ncbi:MAG: LysR family transcriptional regulator [Oscillospiraceae bacterium]|nr:LysR family transcriptional regulator [Oscillospiraceae bacterium]
MELQQLKYFRDLAETQNMRRTSENLHVTQSTVSVAIKKLEEELGAELFTRSNRRLALSEYGRIFLQSVDLALYQLERGVEEIRAARDESDRHVRISCPPYFLTPDFVGYIYREVPDALLEMKKLDSTEIYDAIVDGRLDLSIDGVTDGKGDKVEAVQLKRSRMCIAVAKEHPLAMCRTVLMSELRDTPFSAYGRQMGPRSALERICRKNGFAPKVIFEASAMTDILQPVKSGNCVAYITKSAIGMYDTAGLEFVDVTDTDAYVDVQLCRAKNVPMREAVEKIWNAIIGYYRERGE